MKPKQFTLLILLAILTPACATTPPAPTNSSYSGDTIKLKSLKFSNPRTTCQLLHDVCGVAAYYDARTSTIFIKGPQESVDRAIGIADTLDGGIDDSDLDPSFYLYSLQNAKAADLAPILNALAENGVFSDSNRLGERSTFAIAEPRTNTLIIKTDPFYASRIKILLDKLDRSAIPAEPSTTQSSSTTSGNPAQISDHHHP